MISKSEKILICTAILMFALILGYNAFFVPEIKNVAPVITKKVDAVDESLEIKSGLININKANVEELQNLSGVGEATAERIIEYRETHGGFNNIEEIMEVKGIGKKFFENIKNNITV